MDSDTLMQVERLTRQGYSPDKCAARLDMSVANVRLALKALGLGLLTYKHFALEEAKKAVESGACDVREAYRRWGRGVSSSKFYAALGAKTYWHRDIVAERKRLKAVAKKQRELAYDGWLIDQLLEAHGEGKLYEVLCMMPNPVRLAMRLRKTYGLTWLPDSVALWGYRVKQERKKRERQAQAAMQRSDEARVAQLLQHAKDLLEKIG